MIKTATMLPQHADFPMFPVKMGRVETSTEGTGSEASILLGEPTDRGGFNPLSYNAWTVELEAGLV